MSEDVRTGSASGETSRVSEASLVSEDVRTGCAAGEAEEKAEPATGEDQHDDHNGMTAQYFSSPLDACGSASGNAVDDSDVRGTAWRALFLLPTPLFAATHGNNNRAARRHIDRPLAPHMTTTTTPAPSRALPLDRTTCGSSCRMRRRRSSSR